MRLLLMLFVTFTLCLPVQAGTITVRNTSEQPDYDVFALKKELIAQARWQEWLRNQANLQVLTQLPSGCVLMPGKWQYYHCGSSYYQPYQYQLQQLFIEGVPQEEPAIE